MEQKKTLKTLRDLYLMDDVFMSVAFNEATACADQILDAVFGKGLIKTVCVQTLVDVEELEGKSICMDIYARDAQGRHYNIEIQQKNQEAGLERAVYYVGALGVKARGKGTSYDERIPERYVIFLTRHDLIGLGFPLYHFEWTLQEAPTAQLHERFKPREHIIYINGALKEEGTLLGDLVHDFYCKEAKDVRNPVLRERVRYLKEDEKGVKEMSEAMEKYTKEAREEAWAEGAAKERRDLIRTMLQNGISAEELAKGVGMSVDEIQRM